MWHWILTVTGSNNVSGRWYGFWSGFAGVIPEFAVIGLVWRHLNCHETGCWRISFHRDPETGHATCRKHHHQIQQCRDGEPA